MKSRILGSLGFALLASSIAVAVAASREPAQTPPAPHQSAAKEAPRPGNLEQILSAFRTDLNTSKVATLNRVMQMNAEEASKFWPIYQRYEKELAVVGDRRVALIRQFVALSNEGKLDNTNASTLSAEWLQGEQDRLDLWKKYNKEISAAVSPIRAAQFLQVEHQIALLVDINIASAMPQVGGAKPTAR